MEKFDEIDKSLEGLYPIAWRGVALDLPLLTTYHMNDGVSDCEIFRIFHT